MVAAVAAPVNGFKNSGLKDLGLGTSLSGLVFKPGGDCA